MVYLHGSSCDVAVLFEIGHDTMVSSDGLLRIFWPSDTPRTKKQGTIIGWKNSESDFFVVTVLQDVEVGYRLRHACPHVDRP